MDNGIKLVDKLSRGESRIILVIRPREERTDVAILLTGGLENELHAGNLIREATREVGGGGGGDSKLGRGSVPSDKLDLFMEVVRKRLGGS
ncbi:MAG: hypothetical protein DRN78_06670 [Thermoproteota archaeon]|nr:MAG: hypothetical protein DRN78_06670 [Candidatus Korarchaeota archaeon]